LTLNRPEKFNALHEPLLTDLRAHLEKLDAAPDVRAIILTGAGRAFCSGADRTAGPADAEDLLRRLYNPLIELMVSMSTPTVAAVNGAAAGAGFSLALAADLRIASADASFATAFVRVGLVPDAGATWLLPRIVGLGRAAEITLLGRKITAAQAEAWQMVNEVVPGGELAARSRAVAAELASVSASVGATRQLLRSGLAADLAAQLDAEATAQGHAQKHPHYTEAKSAFLEKRPVQFW
jgi:2-(1,2-epoxy-1,2-dihydrophenyl)acetyl-CoA isomerase